MIKGEIMENDIKFDLSQVDKSFVSFKHGQFVDAVVIQKREDGVVVNIGGKNDAFAGCQEFDEFEKLRIGDCFKALITGKRTEENMIEISKRKADAFFATQELENTIKIGSELTFVVDGASKFGISSKIGNYSIFVPISQISTNFVNDTSLFVGRQLTGVVLEIDGDKKRIVASCRVVAEKEKQDAKNSFFISQQVGNVVKGTVKKILKSGAIVEVLGYDCFIHISDLDYGRCEKVEDFLSVGDEKNFVILKMEDETGRVSLGMKQLYKDPRIEALNELVVDSEMTGEVVKTLRFGAIVKLENGAEGLLHISNLTNDEKKGIHELVRIGDKITVYIKDIDKENNRVSLTTFNPNGETI